MIINHYSLTCIHNNTIPYNIRQYNTYAHTYVRTYSYVHRYIMICIYTRVCMYACMHVCIYICSMSIDGVYQTLEQRYKGTYVHIYIYMLYISQMRMEGPPWQERVRRKVTPGDVFSTLDADQSGTITIEAALSPLVGIGGKTFPKNIKHADINRYIHITTCSYIYNIIYVYIYIEM